MSMNDYWQAQLPELLHRQLYTPQRSVCVCACVGMKWGERGGGGGKGEEGRGRKGRRRGGGRGGEGEEGRAEEGKEKGRE